MNKTELIKLVDTIKGSFGNRFEINEHTYSVWFDMLKELPFEPLMEYVRGTALEQEFPPTLADLKRAAGETHSQRYHQMLRDSAQERFENLNEWAKRAAPPPEGNKERVKELVNRGRSTTQH
jgi:hypothetical protein